MPRSARGTGDRFGRVFPAVASKTVEDLLFPGIGVRVEHVSDSSAGLVVEAIATGQPGRCPDCRKRASRVHSSYQRTLDERPLGDRRVMVRLRVRRYFCDQQELCPPHIRGAGRWSDRTAPPVERRPDGLAAVDRS
ncbi:hypothetical protein FGD71_029945 [Streptomyces sporangiiformans]|uniref:Transposase IS204/IS1001/IS1096/IS1165 zinc-finger domain-containing protein n=1 Tax=Streptomyces sporangiiformans TaxID=2315329 RepID=A0A505DJG4_9ACTN|nr:hypothetical protein FGD71_029945 [Streptomyces sporangiiformans]